MSVGRNMWEVGAVAATALLHPVFVDVLHQRVVFIGLALAGWGLYLGMRAWEQRAVIQHWGFRAQGLGAASVATSVFAMVALVTMGSIAIGRNMLVFRWQMLPLLILYPIWGMFQQLLVQGVFVRAMTDGGSGVWRSFSATALASILFGAVHLPELRLVVATCLLGAVFTPIYIRWGNLWPLGIYHGWLGVFYYYGVLGRDPWAETFLRHV